MPYYSYKKNVLEAKLEHNPYTFLHVINPDYPNEMSLSSRPSERFLKSRKKFEEFIQDGTFIQDSSPCLYLYRQTKDGHQYLGLIAGASIEQYLSGHIKKHEAIINPRVRTFKNYLAALQYNVEPVLLFHEPHAELAKLLEALSGHRPEYEFSSAERIKHEIWVISESELIKKIKEYYDQIKAVYIADGHHRCASSAAYFTSAKHMLNEAEQHFMAYFLPENSMFIQSYNRLIQSIDPMTPADFIKAIEQHFVVSGIDHLDVSPKKHELRLYLNKQWYSIIPKNGVVNENDAVLSLDTSLLTKLILKPILNIEDITHDNRIEFIAGNKGYEGIQQAVDGGKFIAGFSLNPVLASELKRVADEDKIMPPKSTWIEPKLRSGLTIYPLN